MLINTFSNYKKYIKEIIIWNDGLLINKIQTLYNYNVFLNNYKNNINLKI